jgi:hypothetical protein
MLVRIKDQLINTDGIAHAVFKRAVSGSGISGPGGQAVASIVIHFLGGPEVSFGDDVAEQIWDLLNKDVETTIVPPDPSAAK